MAEPSSNKKFEALLEYLQTNRGFDFTGYKRPSLVRRVTRRMDAIGVADFGDYIDYLEVHPEEFAQLFNTILINVTGFFRDEAAWEHLAKEVLPRIIDSNGPGGSIRVWSAGCASGEEAYTLAILLAEALGEKNYLQRVKIYATDVDEDALAQARQASYAAKDLEPVPAALREKYFAAAGSRFAFRADLRRAVIFGRHDLVADAPISRLDLLVCRNTLMYLNAETQAGVLNRLHFAIKNHGFIFLGKAELLLTHANLFSPVTLKHRIFSKVLNATHRDRLLAALPAGNANGANQLARDVRLRDQAFDAGTVAHIVVEAGGTLALANLAARRLFGLSVRDLGRSIQDLELSYRPTDLRSLIEQAYSHRHPASISNVERNQPNGAVQYFDVQVVPLLENGGGILGTSVMFHDVTAARLLSEEVQRAKHEVETAHEELQSTNEELETTNEELQSTVEELETTNEELQSTNEEMETMNEELQSTNEELRTTNEQLRGLTQELDNANSFLRSILGSMRAGVIVVDRELNVVNWNHKSEELWGLRSDEACGRSLFSLDIGLPVELLKVQIRACLEGRQDNREQTLNATNRRGKTIQCRVSCNPHIGSNSEARGVILLIEEVEQ